MLDTALLIGLQEGREKSCVYLIRHGCEVNIVDKLGQTALYLATHTTNETCNSSMCKKLISAGYKIENDSDWLSKDLFFLPC
jgi:ankyrin repeat protein